MDFVQKAKELVEKFSNVEHCGIRHFPNQSYCDCDGGMNNHMAKQCALISINEIIEAIDWHSFETPNAEISYWESIKKEVELL